MHISGELSLGNILTILTLIGIAMRFGWQVGTLQEVVRAHTKRLDQYEVAIIRVVGDVQPLIGRMESLQSRLDRNV